MADKSIQTTNFKFQLIGDGTRWTDMTRTTKVAGASTSGSQELEPADYNTMLTLIDAGIGASSGLSLAGTIAAAGTNQATATPILHRTEVVTGANATKGVLLPGSIPGTRIALENNAAAVLNVYPAGTDTINSLAASTAIAMAANTSADFCCGVAGAWFTVPTVPS